MAMASSSLIVNVYQAGYSFNENLWNFPMDSVQKVLRLKVGLWNLISLGGSICMQIVWQGAIIFEYYLNVFEFNYFIFS